MTSPRQKLSHIVDRSIAPFLRAEGFVKSGKGFVRKLETLTWLIELQSSSLSTSQAKEVTFNLGVLVPGVMSIYSGLPERPAAEAAHGVLHVRAGMLLPGNRDIWWRIDFNCHEEAIGAEMVRVLQDGALPFFARFPATLDAAEYLTADRPRTERHVFPYAEAVSQAYAAILFAIAGVQDREEAALRRAEASANGTPAAEIVGGLRERLIHWRSSKAL